MRTHPNTPHLIIATCLLLVIVLSTQALGWLPVTFGLDLPIMLTINQGLSHPALDLFFIWVSSRTGFSTPLMLLILLGLVWKFRLAGLKLWGLFIATIIFGDVFGNLLKGLFSLPRPCAEIFELILQPKQTQGGSCGAMTTGMPSNHTLNFVIAAVFLGLSLKKWPWVGVTLAGVALSVSISRIYLGAHYPGQVLLGASLGVLIGMLSHCLGSRYFQFMAEIKNHSSACCVKKPNHK